MKLSISRSEYEIARLISLGFHDWEQDKNGVRVSEFKISSNKEKISFPQSAYVGKSLKRDDFWSRHRASLIIESIISMNQQVIWELGGGDGRVGLQIAEAGIGVISVEPLYEGCAKVAKMGLPVFSGVLSDLNLPDNSLQSVGFFDVLEHIEDDREFLKFLHSKLSTRGLIFLTVPAHKWLFSQHDLALGHFRRYDKRNLSKILNECGFEVLINVSVFQILVIPALILRRVPYVIGIRNKSEKIVVRAERMIEVPKWLDTLLSFLLKIEKMLPAPVGLSIFCVARKK